MLYLLIDSFKTTYQDQHSAGTTLKLAEADEGMYIHILIKRMIQSSGTQCCFKFGLVV